MSMGVKGKLEILVGKEKKQRTGSLEFCKVLCIGNLPA